MSRLSDADYAKLVELSALPGLDVLPLREIAAKTEYALIRRLDFAGVEGYNLPGGRIRKGEALDDAIGRHLHETLGVGIAVALPDALHPVSVSQYLAQQSPAGGPFDPRKHQVSLNYLAAISGEVVAGGEALAVEWFDLEVEPPDDFGFGQRSVAAELVAAARMPGVAQALLDRLSLDR